MDYSKMPSKDRPFLHHSMCSPHPDKSDVMMRLMIFANPALLGLLNGVVDLFIDATFSCVPAPFYQCLIIMVFDPSTNHYLPVIYALMLHKVQELYWQMFNQLFFLTKWKMQVCTFTSDFEMVRISVLAGVVRRIAQRCGSQKSLSPTMNSRGNSNILTIWK
jgi:hypothetical protein